MGKVILVPSFHPLFTVMVRIFSLVLVVLPSSFNTCTHTPIHSWYCLTGNAEERV